MVRIYSLRPKEEGLNSPHWEASAHKGSCLVYANSMQEAVKLANLKFQIAVCKPPLGQEIPNNPWAKSSLVSIREVYHMSGDLPPCGTVMV